MQAALLNILINTKGMRNRGLAEELNAKALNMMSSYGSLADAVFEKIKSSLDSTEWVEG
jgi:formiminotetrahydrofolate cyclodeaminase